ncbi:MAG: hypothetical protein JWN62_2412 [Acidimicrobiales bacterium]|nr:hypothetical protein [Acidimicrobiales bacterium]
MERLGAVAAGLLLTSRRWGLWAEDSIETNT